MGDAPSVVSMESSRLLRAVTEYWTVMSNSCGQKKARSRRAAGNQKRAD
jgi:hypothetical protein